MGFFSRNHVLTIDSFDSNNIRARKCYWTCRDKFQMIHKFRQLLINWMLAISDWIVQMVKFATNGPFSKHWKIQWAQREWGAWCVYSVSTSLQDYFSSWTTHVCFVSSYYYSHTTFHFSRVLITTVLSLQTPKKHVRHVLDAEPSAIIMNQIIRFIFSHMKKLDVFLSIDLKWCKPLLLLHFCLSTNLHWYHAIFF